jgi:homoserine dehydrogenase
VSVIRVGLFGFGVVGQAVARVATQASGRLADAGVLVKCVGALVRDVHRPRVAPDLPLFDDAEAFPFGDCDVIVEALGGAEPARTLVSRALRARIPVVSANKTLIATHGRELLAEAEAHGVSLLFEAAVMAGVPCVNTLARRPLASGAGEFAGILNGTSHYILSRMTRGESFAAVLADAITRGYAEPASDADTGGRDAAEKLTILLHLAGHADVTVATFPRRGIEDLHPWHLEFAGRAGGVIKPVATARLHGPSAGSWVGPAFVPRSHPFAALEGVTNVLSVGSGPGTVTFSGPGAGPEVTASTIIDDILETHAGRSAVSARPPVAPAAAPALSHIPAGAWFLAVDRVTTSTGELAEFLASRQLPAVLLVGEHERRVVITAPAPFSTLRDAVDALSSSGVRVTWLPVIGEVSRG